MQILVLWRTGQSVDWGILQMDYEPFEKKWHFCAHSYEKINMFFTYRKSIAALGLLLSAYAVQGQEIQQPNVQSESTFAIVVDTRTYQAAEAEIKAYQASVERNGLGTYVIHDQWASPQPIRQLLLELHRQEEAPLEGAVFIGDIPVPMIRDAQHLTSAFKMNQTMRWERSSVPSDRYYDDFDLQFRFLNQDTADSRQQLFYFSLAPESPQYLEMDIYTARIKPPVSKGENMIPKIKAYLNKLVQQRNQENPLDDMIASYGHGYNSNAINSLTGEMLTLKSQLPQLFRPGGSMKMLNFRNHDFVKFNLLSELKRDALDFAYMTGHGTTTLQLLNGYPYVSAPQPSMENVSRYLRSKVRSAKDAGRDVEATIERFKTSLGVSDKWFKDAFDPASIQADSIYNDNLDIQIRDIKDAGIKAKVVYLNSCLMGSYQLDDYIAGYYPFSENDNLVAIANSVGVLQDLWGTEMMGLLTHGYRMGNWLKHIAYLETHLLGDPTFHFAASGSNALNLQSFSNRSTAFWKQQLTQDDADLQSLALLRLTGLLPEAAVSPILKQHYFQSPFESTRMQAFELLRQFENEAYVEVLHAAKNDSYEYIRRQAVRDLTAYGADEFVEDVIAFYVNDPHSERVIYNTKWALQFINPERARDAVDTLIRKNPSVFAGEQLAAQLDADLAGYEKRRNDLLHQMENPQSSEKEKLSALRTLRLYRHHNLVPAVIRLVKDKQNTKALRVTGLEVLGWFDLSYQREAIVAGCEEVLNSEAPQTVKDEALKT